MADQKTMGAGFDPLDMNNYRIEKLPKMQKSKFETWMARLGGPIALLVFIWINWFSHIGFIRACYSMLAIFVASLILWMTEAIPNYLTSLLVILGIVLFNVTTVKATIMLPIFMVLYMILTFLMMYSGLVFQSKPAALLYNTNMYSQTDAFTYGITMMTISWLLILLWGGTVLKWMGVTPGLF